MTDGTHLPGLEGTNPLGFLAALGVQTAFAGEQEQPCLRWSEDVTPHAVVNHGFSVDRIAKQTLAVAARWKDSPALNPVRPDGARMPKGDELKLSADDIADYLRRRGPIETGGGLAVALLAEDSLDKQGVAKPSDLYFTAGQMKFLGIARTILSEVSHEELVEGLVGPWQYASLLPSLGWDVVDDRVYALRANNPAPDKKLTNPGAETLAILGLSRHPVFAGRERTLTQGCSGSWKSGHYSWPLWRKAATPNAVGSLLAHAYDGAAETRQGWYRSWGVFTILQSPIRRSSQGGYGTFGPSEVTWLQS